MFKKERCWGFSIDFCYTVATLIFQALSFQENLKFMTISITLKSISLAEICFGAFISCCIADGVSNDET